MIPSHAGPKLAYFALAWISIVWGSTYLASRIGVEDGLPGLYLSAIRLSSAGFLMLLFFRLRGHAWPKGRDEWRKVLGPGFLLLLCGNGAMTWAMQYMDSSLGAIVSALGPLITALLSVWLLGQRLSWQVFAGLGLGGLGIGIIFSDYWAELLQSQFRFGLFLAFGSTFAWSLGSILAVKWQHSLHPVHAAGWQMFGSGLALLPICWSTGQYQVLSALSSQTYWALLYLIVVGSLISYSAFSYAIQQLPPSLVAVNAYINPIVALILGWLILSEKLSWKIALGAAVVLVGIYWVNKAMKKI
jgi:drug/metabolite transporter (DMT)-like permease